jgi:hypothetical protein
VEARNSFGYSAFSSVASILCAAVPSTPTTPTTTADGGDVVISWVKPNNNGLTITSYTITIETSIGTYETELTDCNGSSVTIVTNVECSVPFTTLIVSPFNLDQGDSIKVLIIATNAYGNSFISVVGNGALVVLVPDAPASIADDSSVTLED